MQHNPPSAFVPDSATSEAPANLSMLHTHLANIRLPKPFRPSGAKDPGGPTASSAVSSSPRLHLKRFFARRVPFEEHVRELASLRLAGRPHNAEILARALDEEYGIQVQVARFSGPLPARGVSPETIHYRGDDSYTIWLPEGLSWWHR